MVWDGTRVVLFGGFTTSHNAETWKYEAGDWTQLAPATSPPSRSYHRMVWDGSRIIMFGGTRPGTSFLSDTWEFSGGTWTQLSPATVPGGRDHHAMVWTGSRVLMYGGTTALGAVPTDQTWEYVTGNWHLLTPTHSPGADSAAFGSTSPGRLQHRMVWDGTNVVMLGGRSDSNVYPSNPSNQASGNTWLFATDWTQTAPAGDPQLRYAFVMTVTDDGQAIMFGGDVSSTGSLGEVVITDTQVYESGAWTNMGETYNPGPRLNSDMVWDGDRVILFGGEYFTTATSDAPNAETWEYAGPVPPAPGTAASIHTTFGVK